MSGPLNRGPLKIPMNITRQRRRRRTLLPWPWPTPISYIAGKGDPRAGAKDYTPEITKMRIHRKLPLKIHLTILGEIHWKSDNPLEDTTDKWNSVGKCRWKSIGQCHWKSTMISEVLISGVQYFASMSGELHDPRCTCRRLHTHACMRTRVCAYLHT